MADTHGDAQVQIRLVARDQRYAVTESSMLVPSQLRRVGLSEVVNHLLGSSVAVNFDFLVQGTQLLRTSLATYIAENSLSTEQVITLEYFRASNPPKLAASYPHDDWVSSVSGRLITNSSVPPVLLSGCFDGEARLWNLSGTCIGATGFARKADSVATETKMPMKAVAWGSIPDETLAEMAANPSAAIQSFKIPFYTASQDKHVLGWVAEVDALASDAQGQTTTTLVDYYTGHTASVESISASARHKLLVSGSYEGDVLVHSLNDEDYEDDEEDDQDDEEEDGKRRKKNNGGKKTKKNNTNNSNKTGTRKVQHKPQMAKISALHTGCVSSLIFDQFSETPRIFSTGWDKTLIHTDVETQSALTTMTCDSVVLDVDQQDRTGSQLLATGHADHCIRLWDPRINDGVAVRMKLGAHKGWVSGVTWQHNKSSNSEQIISDYSLASCSYDNKVRIWDIRSTAPIYTVTLNGTENKKKISEISQDEQDTSTLETKMFDIDWVANDLFVASTEKVWLLTV